jgi:hypothetical protein
MIHPDIAHALPLYHDMDASFMRNFCLCVLAGILNNPVIGDVLLEDVVAFTLHHVIAAK